MQDDFVLRALCGKADAVKKTRESDLTNQVPATMLKTHSNFHLFLDKDSATKVADKI